MRWVLFFLFFSLSLQANHVYLIYHEERTDHKEQIEKILNKEKLSVTYKTAVNAAHFSKKKKRALLKKYRTNLRTEALGRYLTQRAILEEADKKGWEQIWVLEGDSLFVEEVKTLSEHLKILRPEWDLFHSGSSFLVSKGGIKKLLQQLKEPIVGGELVALPGLQEYRDPCPMVKRNGAAYLSAGETPVADYLKPIALTHLESGLSPIDCIYVINLDARQDKWDRLQPLLQARGLKTNRVSAVNGWKLSKEDKKRLTGPYHTLLRGGQIGCLLSHVSVLKDAHKRGFEHIWVLEDDVAFSEDFLQLPKLLETLSSVDPEWDIFYTDPDCKNEKGEYYQPEALAPRPDQLLQPFDFYRVRTLIDANLMQIHNRFALHSIILSKRGIKKILDYFTHVYLFSPIDWDLNYIPGIRQYAARKDIVTTWRQSPYSDTIAESSLNN